MVDALVHAPVPVVVHNFVCVEETITIFISLLERCLSTIVAVLVLAVAVLILITLVVVASITPPLKKSPTSFIKDM